MSLPKNPFAAAAQSVQKAAAQASNAFKNGALSAGGSNPLASVNSKVNQLGGGIGSPLSGFGGGGTNIGGFNSGVTTAINNAAGAGGSIGGIGGLLSKVGAATGLVTAGVAGIAGLGTAIAGLGSGSASLGAVFGQIAAAAGQLNNLLSLGRAKSLPSGAELFTTVGPGAQVKPVDSADWRVRLNCAFSTIFPDNELMKQLSATNGVVWPYLPNIKISHKANYNTKDPVHNNFPYLMYKNSQVDDISIDGEFSVQNSEEGLYWLAVNTFLRAATKMFYGEGQFAGNPPIICRLTGYGPYVFNNIPVVIKSFNIDLKEDVNYIEVKVGTGSTWVPTMSNISVVVAPVYNRERLRKFSLQNFAQGKEVGII